ncbi:Uncharacterised protein [Serratia marcescens]|nr:Uncharacterised protein [Serratia marcescens]
MNRDHLHQMPVALQPQLLIIGLAIRLGDLLCQPAHQRMFAVELRRRLLQQLPQMQHVGQTTLATGAGQQVLRQLARFHHLAQHRQHAAAQPERAVIIEFVNQLVPGTLIAAQAVQRRRVQPHQPGGHGAAQRALLLRRQHRLQQPQQVFGLRGVEHAVAVRQVDRRNGQRAQRIAHQRRLIAAAHQHRDIGSLYRPWLLAALQPRLALLPGAEPVANLRGAQARHQLLVITYTGAFPLLQPELHRRLRLAVQVKRQPLVLFRRADLDKGDLAEQERLFYLRKQVIDAGDHRRRRAPVGLQRIVGAHL